MLFRSSDNGDLTREINGSVDKCTVNAKIDESKFTVEFPVGTHVHDSSKGDYIQQPAGKIKPISPKEYGVIPSDLATASPVPISWFSVSVTATMVGVLLIAVYRKHSKG